MNLTPLEYAEITRIAKYSDMTPEQYLKATPKGEYPAMLRMIRNNLRIYKENPDRYKLPVIKDN